MLRAVLLGAFVAVSAAPAARDSDVIGRATAAGRPVAEAVIWIDAPAGFETPTAAAPAVLEQRNLEFVPHVLAVQVGAKVKFPNYDRVLHNVFSYHEGRPFDLGLYPVGEVKNVPFDRPGLSRVFCNIHSQMSAYIMVVETPHFAVTDALGRFRIPGVPAGVHGYHAWRASSKTIVNGTIDVRDGAALTVEWP